MQREPAQEEAQHHSKDDTQCSLGAGPTSVQAPLCSPVHHQVTDHNDQEREEESHDEAEGGDDPGAEHSVDCQTLSLVFTCFDLLGVDKLRDAADQGQEPDGNAPTDGPLGSSVVLAPDGFADHHPAIHADQHQLQDAAVHHQVKQAFDHRASQRAKVPVVIVG